MTYSTVFITSNKGGGIIMFLPVLVCLSVYLSVQQRRRYNYVFARACLSVCLFVCEQNYSKTRAWMWMKCCVSTDVGTWTNWLTFESDLDYSPDKSIHQTRIRVTKVTNVTARPLCQKWTGLLSLQRGIVLSRENPTYRYWAAAMHGFTMVLFTASRRNNFVGGARALPSAVLDCVVNIQQLCLNSRHCDWRYHI